MKWRKQIDTLLSCPLEDVLPFSPTSTYENWLMALQKRSKNMKEGREEEKEGEKGKGQGKWGEQGKKGNWSTETQAAFRS